MHRARSKTQSYPSQTDQEEQSTTYTEAILIDSFAKSLSKNFTSRQATSRVLVAELDGIQGRPDLVDIHLQALPGPISLDVLAKCFRSPAKSTLLAILRYGARRRRAYLEKSTGFTKQTLRSHLKALEESGLVQFHENATVSLSCPLPWGMANIVTYEGKLTNWRRAFHQALGYRSFSHSVWIVMPTSGAEQAKKLEHAFRANGIGLVAYERDGGTRTVIRSKKLRPASRRLYLMAVGAGLAKFVEERRRSHLRIRPESIKSIEPLLKMSRPGLSAEQIQSDLSVQGKSLSD